MYAGWALPEWERKWLLELFRPAYPVVIAHHVTLAFGVKKTFPLPQETLGEIVGIADDGHAVQALVVSIGGTTQRPDGRTYHITWSLGPGAKPVDSNRVIEQGWNRTAPLTVMLVPRLFGQGEQDGNPPVAGDFASGHCGRD